MGRHAAPRTPLWAGDGRTSTVQRAAAVSTGTLLLCLTAAPAMASSAPPPVPKPVNDLVQQVSNATGIPNPLAPPAGVRRHHHTTSHRAPASHPTTVASHSSGSTVAVGAALPAVAAVTVHHRGGAAHRHRTPIPSAAVTRSDVVPATALAPLPPVPPQDAARILAVAMATLLLGGLAGGHLKAAQHLLVAR